ncbi:ATP-binding cassette domain-containing protein [Ectobacillus funiculus]|uniref:ATP-binding cassette domain-containing protein n=1 Tax=Ectobacillus funiculus TaxID=137993 RepID=UPI00101C4091|nr:ATP-binding cassette domain-containing protein [Ectobacillus funiculus]
MIWKILCILGIILLLRIFIGLIGSNGSGKTIWMELLAGLVRQTEGEIYVDGKKIGRKTKAVVSYLQDNPSFDGWMKVEDALHFYELFYLDFEMGRCLRK